MTTRKNFKKRVSTVTAVLLAAAMLLGATYAWRDTRQHKTNPFTAKSVMTGAEGMETRDVTLNNVFTPPTAWSWSETVGTNIKTPNNISVTNSPSSTTHVFVRLSVKEYMELKSVKFDDGKGTVPDSELYYTDDAGNLILVATYQGQYLTTADAIARGFNAYGVLQVVTGKKSDGTLIYQEYATTTVAEQRDGIYGKAMLKDSMEVVWGDTPKAPIINGPQTPGKGECAYTPIIKGVAPRLTGNRFETSGIPSGTNIGTVDKYIDIGWNTDVISFEQWKDWKTKNHGDWIEKWIYDPTKVTSGDGDTAQEGWVYWGTPLPSGKTTTDLIESISTIGGVDPLKLITGTASTRGRVDYVLHTDMEAVSGFMEFDDGDKPKPESSEINKLFKPTLPKGVATDPEILARDEFFKMMNDYELESFDDRGTLRTGKRVLRLDLGSETRSGFINRHEVSKDTSGNFSFTLPAAPTDRAATQAVEGMKFNGWASTRAAAAAKRTDVATYNGTSFNPAIIHLNQDVTRLYAVWTVIPKLP